MSEYDNLIRLLTNDADIQSTSQLQKLSAQQQESVQRLTQKSVRTPKSVPELEDPMKECTFKPEIISKSKNYIPKDRNPHQRLYEQGKQKIETLNRKIEEKKMQEAIENERQQPTFRPTLISSSKAKQRADQDTFNALYNDAVRQKAKRDEQLITFTNVDTFKPKTHTRAYNRESTVQTIVDQLVSMN